VLAAQVPKAKDELAARLRAEGVEFEERQRRLDEVEHPKPLAEFAYSSWNTFVARRPWLARENVRPKSIAREMFERFMSFGDYVKEYGLSRSEGVLLRYLAEVHKTLRHSIPAAAKTPPVLELQAWLQAVIEQVDDSLLRAWERLVNGRNVEVDGQTTTAAVETAPPIEAQLRARADLLARALAGHDFDEAAALGGPDRADAPWTAERLAEEVTRLESEIGPLRFDAHARRRDMTLVDRWPDGTWRVRRRLPGEGEEEGVVEAFCESDGPASAPLVLRIDTIGV
jgi:hypothetical protein